MLKIAAPILLLLLLGASAVCAQERSVEVQAGPVLVEFSPPPGFERVSAEEAAAPSALGRAPAAVFREPRGGLRITVSVFDAEGQGLRDVRALKKKLESDLAAANPAAKWLSRAVVKMEGVNWARLHFRTAADGGEVISETYATVWAGEAVVVNFHGPAAEHEARRADLRKTAESIGLSISVIAPAGDARP